jgi:hypothetical protein
LKRIKEDALVYGECKRGIWGMRCRNQYVRKRLALKAALEKVKAKKDADDALKAAGSPVDRGFATNIVKTAKDAAKSKKEAYEENALKAKVKKCIRGRSGNGCRGKRAEALTAWEEFEAAEKSKADEDALLEPIGDKP